MSPKDAAEKAVKEWFAYQDSFELELALISVSQFKPKVICEIGVAYGGSLAAWTEITKPELAIGIDPLVLIPSQEQKDCLESLIKKYDIKFIPHASCLPEAHTKMEEILGGKKVDFLFIDAEHRYDDVRQDWDQYQQYLADEAIVGFHDIYYSDRIFDSGSQVSFLWDRLKKKYDYDEFYFHSSMGIGLIYYKR